MAAAVCLGFAILLSIVSYISAADNVTRLTISPGSKYVTCGFYSLDVTLWAATSTAWLYFTDGDCNAATGLPCLAPTSAPLNASACVGLPSCARRVVSPDPAATPLCLVLLNMDGRQPLEADLRLTGSVQPLSGSGSGGSSGSRRDFAVGLIIVAGCSAALVVLGLVVLWSWLACCRARPGSQVSPATGVDGPGLAAKTQQGLGLSPGPPPSIGALGLGMGTGLGAAPMPPALLRGTLVLLPPPPLTAPSVVSYAGKGTTSAPWPPPLHSAGGAVSPSGVLRAAGGAVPLAPLPADAYGRLGTGTAAAAARLAAPAPPVLPWQVASHGGAGGGAGGAQ